MFSSRFASIADHKVQISFAPSLQGRAPEGQETTLRRLMRHIHLAPLVVAALLPVHCLPAPSPRSWPTPRRSVARSTTSPSGSSRRRRTTMPRRSCATSRSTAPATSTWKTPSTCWRESHFRTEQWMEAETEFGILVENYERSPHHRRGSLEDLPAARSTSLLRGIAIPVSRKRAIKRYRAYLSGLPRRAAHRFRPYGPVHPPGQDGQASLQDRAQLYLRMDEPLAATVYYNYLFREFPESKDVPQARLDVARAYAQLDQFDRARETLDTLRSTPRVRRSVRSTSPAPPSSSTRPRPSSRRTRPRKPRRPARATCKPKSRNRHSGCTTRRPLWASRFVLCPRIRHDPSRIRRGTLPGAPFRSVPAYPPRSAAYS
jgi:hypothetical protein